GSTSDQAFATEVLGASLENDDAGTYDVVGSGILDGVDWSFAAEDAPYDVEWPDVLATDRPVIATYGPGGTAGSLGDRVAVFGFPFEAINGANPRAEVATRVLKALAPDYVPPKIDDQPQDTGDPTEDWADPRTLISETAGCGCTQAPSLPGTLWVFTALTLLVGRRRW
ncbi:MAG: hypothetical protein AB8H79_09080, partial [Myxococcota bacterium]